MEDIWVHPRLGKFVFNDYSWRQDITPTWQASFTYRDAIGLGVTPGVQNHFELVLECDEGEDAPNEAMVSLAITILDNDVNLVAMLLDAFWADINQQGPDSGMWWHGDLSFPNRVKGGGSFIREALHALKLPLPTSPKDLKTIMEPTHLAIRRELSVTERWAGEFSFHSAIDVEHGVGVLTDGMAIIGIGYSGEARRFGRE